MKKYIETIFKKENLIYTISAIVLVICLIINRSLMGFSNILWITDIGSLFFLAYMITFAKHNVWAFLLNIITTTFVGVSALIQHLYFNFALAFVFTIPMNICGWILWKKRQATNDNLHTLSKKQWIWLIAAFVVVCPIVILILYYLGGNLIYLDGPCSTLTIMGVILASNTFIENFYVFEVSNLLYSAMYFILCFQNMNNLPFAIINLISFVIVIGGIVDWHKLKKQKEQVEKVIVIPDIIENNNEKK